MGTGEMPRSSSAASVAAGMGDKAPDCPSDERKRDEKKCGCGFRSRTRSLVDSNRESRRDGH